MAYEINININGDVDGSQSINGMSSTSSANNETEKAQKRLAKYISSQTIQPFIHEVKSAVSQDIGLITGNSELQERVNFGFQAVQYGVNAYKNVQAGAIIGSQLGIGGGVGAIIGLAMTAISTSINLMFNQLQIDIKHKLEDYQLAQVRSRAGIAFNRSRRGN